MKLTLADIVESQLNANPRFYSMLSTQQKAVSDNILLSKGEYFDEAEGKVKIIQKKHE